MELCLVIMEFKKKQGGITMRNLTITRTKSFVGCAAKMKVYIEDPVAGDTTISGVTCRKLGTLKSGETATFSIGYEAARVYVIADQVSKNYSNDYYPLEEGVTDVTLTGKNHFNPGAGNPFLFDGVTDPAVLANRKKSGKKGIWVIIVSAILGALIGFNNTRTVKAQDFTVDNMTITLTSEFREEELEGFTQCYDSSLVGVVVLKESTDEYPWLADYTLEEYGEDVIWNNDLTDSTLTSYGDFYYFIYTAQGSNGQPYQYFATVHRNGNDFWLIQFAALQKNFSKMENKFLEWASTVRFGG